MIEPLEQHEVGDAVRSESTVIDFWMDDFPPCNLMDPKLRTMADEHEDVPVYRVKAQEGDELLERLAIEAMPAVLFFKDGTVADRLEGVVHSGDLEDAFKRLPA